MINKSTSSLQHLSLIKSDKGVEVEVGAEVSVKEKIVETELALEEVEEEETIAEIEEETKEEILEAEKTVVIEVVIKEEN